MQIPGNRAKISWRCGLACALCSMRVQGEATLEYMDGDAVKPEKIAEGVSAVVMLIAQESNGTFPGELVIPVGVELIAHAVDGLQKA